jgi:CDP-glycerol glycerophosphotransferase (TagB/SpsB family)
MQSLAVKSKGYMPFQTRHESICMAQGVEEIPRNWQHLDKFRNKKDWSAITTRNLVHWVEIGLFPHFVFVGS